MQYFIKKRREFKEKLEEERREFKKKRSPDNLYKALEFHYSRFLKANNLKASEGICCGLTYMWIQAILCGDEANFATKLNKASINNIAEYNKYLSLRQNELDMRAFFNGLLAYQYPAEVFNDNKLNQKNNMKKISRCFLPVELENKCKKMGLN